MGKYANGSKSGKKQYKQKKKRSFGWFLLGMFIYAALFLGAAWYGLTKFWAYIEAYELSRPDHAIEGYMEQLTAEHVADQCQGVIDQIDHNLQSEEECRTYILEALSGGINYAKKSKECTDTRQVFVLRTGATVIGEFSIAANAPDEYGFTTWGVEGESFDMSYLINPEILTITVPDVCGVWVNGHQLDESYLVGEKIIYEEVEEYYEEYDMPYRVTYEAGPFLGQMEISATDADGNPVTFDENTDYSAYYLNCTAEETQALDAFTAEVLDRYIAFTGSSKNTRYGAYKSLIEIVVPDSDLASRLEDALEGLQFGQSKGDEIVSIETHYQLRLDEGEYVCDVTYELDTTGKNGVVRTTSSCKLTVVENSGELLLESINFY